MKRLKFIGTTLFASLFLSFFTTAGAQNRQGLVRQVVMATDTTVWGIPVDNISIKKNDGLMAVGVDMAVGRYDLRGDKVAVFTPLLANGKDTLNLTSIGLYSRIRYINYLRDGRVGVSGPNEISYKYSKRPYKAEINEAVPYAEWMNGATLFIERRDYGCCHTLVNRELIPVGKWHEAAFSPVFHYVTPEAEAVKTRQLTGRAYIDFPVNMTDLYPDYRNNPAELQKIIATIDSVRNDKDININEITIKGYASPESSWENNTRLAKGRTATLKKYVQNLYKFDSNLIKSDYWPEDWDGLREFVDKSGLAHRNEILALIDDTTIDPDPKEALLKKRYPDEYDFLLKTVYPGLRHSDYTILYTIRRFSDPDEIKRVMAETPQKLSLDEFFILARRLEPGSDEYNNVFETAVRMYPSNEIANLNAANSEMQRGNLERAARYLEKAGTSDAANYSRGILAALNGDYTEALRLLNQASTSIPEASNVANEIKEILRFQ